MKTKCACRVMSKQQCCKSKVVLLAFLTCNFFFCEWKPLQSFLWVQRVRDSSVRY